MSIVSRFVQAAANQAFPMLGEEALVIGESVIMCIFSEIENSRDFASGGFEPTKRLQATFRTSDLPDGYLLKKACTARGESFRVESIRKGKDFVTMTLQEVEKA